jgi:hypothetical protein
MTNKALLNKIIKVFNIAVRELRNDHREALVAAYVAGSFANIDDNVILLTPYDIDIHVIIDTDKLHDRKFELKRSRYGERINFLDCSPIQSKIIEHLIVDLRYLPYKTLTDPEHLLRTHSQYAASSNIFHTTIYYDPKMFLKHLKTLFCNSFSQKKYIHARLDNIISAANQKLIEYEYDRKIDYSIYKNYVDGPFWALMCAGNLIITYGCKTPTFRIHLLLINDITSHLDQRYLYRNLLEVWRFDKFKIDDIIYFFNKMRDLYSFILASEIQNLNINVNPNKYNYWIDGINKMIKLKFYTESLFPILFILLNLGQLYENEKIESGRKQEFIFGLVQAMGHNLFYDGNSQVTDIKNLLGMINSSLS